MIKHHMLAFHHGFLKVNQKAKRLIGSFQIVS